MLNSFHNQKMEKKKTEPPILQKLQELKSVVDRQENGSCCEKLLSLLIHLYRNDLKNIVSLPDLGVSLFFQFLNEYNENMEDSKKRLSTAEKYRPKLHVYQCLRLFDDFIEEFEKLIENTQDVNEDVLLTFNKVLSTLV